MSDATGSYDLTTVPDLPGGDESRYVHQRSRYLTNTTILPERKARALAYRELGYSHSGIAGHLDVTEGTVAGWMDEIAKEYGWNALETRPQSNPVGRLE